MDDGFSSWLPATRAPTSPVLCVNGASCRSPERSPARRWSTSAPDGSSQASATVGWWRPVCPPHTKDTSQLCNILCSDNNTSNASSPRPVFSHHLHLRHLIAPFCSLLHCFFLFFFVCVCACFFQPENTGLTKHTWTAWGLLFFIFLYLEHKLQRNLFAASKAFRY